MALNSAFGQLAQRATEISEEFSPSDINYNGDLGGAIRRHIEEIGKERRWQIIDDIPTEIFQYVGHGGASSPAHSSNNYNLGVHIRKSILGFRQFPDQHVARHPQRVEAIAQ